MSLSDSLILFATVCFSALNGRGQGRVLTPTQTLPRQGGGLQAELYGLMIKLLMKIRMQTVS